MTGVIDRDGAVRDVIEGIMYRDEFNQKMKPLLLNVGARRSASPCCHAFYITQLIRRSY